MKRKIGKAIEFTIDLHEQSAKAAVAGMGVGASIGSLGGGVGAAPGALVGGAFGWCVGGYYFLGKKIAKKLQE